MTSEKDIDSTFPYIEEKENNPPEVHKEIEDIVTNYDTLHFPELFEEKFK